MPHFEVATYASQLFWLFVCFFVLYLYSAKIAFPKLKALLDQRWRHTVGNREKAEALDKENEAVRKAYEIELNKAKKLAHEEIATAHAQLNKQVSLRREEVYDQIQERFRIEETRLKNKRQDILEHASETADLLALSIVSCFGSKKDTSTSRRRSKESPE